MSCRRGRRQAGWTGGEPERPVLPGKAKGYVTKVGFKMTPLSSPSSLPFLSIHLHSCQGRPSPALPSPPACQQFDSIPAG